MSMDQYNPSYAPLGLGVDPDAFYKGSGDDLFWETGRARIVKENTAIDWSGLGRGADTEELKSLNLQVAADNTVLRNLIKELPATKERRPILAGTLFPEAQGMQLTGIDVRIISDIDRRYPTGSLAPLQSTKSPGPKNPVSEDELIWTRFTKTNYKKFITGEVQVNLPKVLDMARNASGDYDVNVARLLSSGVAAGIRQLAEQRIPWNSERYNIGREINTYVPFLGGMVLGSELAGGDILSAAGVASFIAVSSVIGHKVLSKLEGGDPNRLSPKDYRGSPKRFTEKLDQALSVPLVVTTSAV